MKFLATIVSLSVLASQAFAIPLAQPRQFEAQITFIGAADASFSLSVPTDGSVFTISASPSFCFLSSSHSIPLSFPMPLFHLYPSIL